MNKSIIRQVWQKIYGTTQFDLLNDFFMVLDNYKGNIKHKDEGFWYKDVVIYSLYVDLFNNDFNGLEKKLDYLYDLGVNCLWLLPILDSPMRDAGFDIRDYKKIRAELLPIENQDQNFQAFINKAHLKGIKIIFDIATNHTSDQHEWFKNSKSSKNSEYRDYYIWSSDNKKYSQARVIFEGMEDSNWKKEGSEYYFHRFFDFQPDLNYRNPEVLLKMSENLLFWINMGVDGFRADAIPFLWKEEGTSCENLKKTHLIIKFFRAVLDYVRPNILLLAEACQKPKDIVKYFGNEDECNAAYHFPLMAQIFKAIAVENPESIIKTLSEDISPKISESSQWFTFLRCHDEFSLESVYVNESDSKLLYKAYCKSPNWNFRNGQGISARLAEMLDRNPKKILLAYSIMLSLPGTPVIYYGDELAKLNDVDFYEEAIQKTGKNDTRFLVRGRIDWDKANSDLKNHNSLTFKVFHNLKKLLKARQKTNAFGRGTIEWVNIEDDSNYVSKSILAFIRKYDRNEFLIIHNLSDDDIKLEIKLDKKIDFIGNELIFESDFLIIKAFAYHWIKIQ